MKLPKWFCRLLSYISVLTIGAYLHATDNGEPVELHRWILTCFFGLMFYAMSLSEKRI